jgi:hypothetical protein
MKQSKKPVWIIIPEPIPLMTPEEVSKDTKKFIQDLLKAHEATKQHSIHFP